MEECNRSYIAPQLGALFDSKMHYRGSYRTSRQLRQARALYVNLGLTQVWCTNLMLLHSCSQFCCVNALRAIFSLNQVLDSERYGFILYPVSLTLSPHSHHHNGGYMAVPIIFLTLYLFFNGLLTWHDLRYGLLPDRFTCPLLWSGLAYACICHTDALPQKVWGAILGYLGFASLYWGYRLIRKKEGLGYGDVKFLAALGAWHGWQSLVMLVLVASLLACMMVCVVFFTSKREGILKNPLPFGPFLAGAGLMTGYQDLFWGVFSFRL